MPALVTSDQLADRMALDAIGDADRVAAALDDASATVRASSVAFAMSRRAAMSTPLISSQAVS